MPNTWFKETEKDMEELQITQEDIEAVSYTHLDVYKRQQYNLSTQRFK